MFQVIKEEIEIDPGLRVNIIEDNNGFETFEEALADVSYIINIQYQGWGMPHPDIEKRYEEYRRDELEAGFLKMEIEAEINKSLPRILVD